MAAEVSDSIHPGQPRAGVSGVLKGKPLEARFAISEPSAGTGEWVAEIFRSTSGSVRTNLSGGRFSWILDGAAQRLIILDHTSRTAVVTPVKLHGSHPMWGYNKVPTPTQEIATFLGVACRRVILSEDRAASVPAGEIWIAEDLGVVVKDVKPIPGGTLVWRAISIKLAEPAATNFEVPEGYKILVAAQP